MTRDSAPATIHCPACQHAVAREAATVWVLSPSTLTWRWGGEVELRCGACGKVWTHKIGEMAR